MSGEDRERPLSLALGHRRIVLAGPMGAGKSTLARRLAAELERRGRRVSCIGCDPGSPAFGPPGAVCLGVWQDGEWQLLDLEPLCTLDAARFRLPLCRAVARLAKRAPDGTVLLDAPGAARGVVAAELLAGLVDAGAVDLVVLLERGGAAEIHQAEVAALTVPVQRMASAAEAHAPSKRARAKHRTALWDAHLAHAKEHAVHLDAVQCVGMPPPRDAPAAWAGRQIALLDGGRCLALGEVSACDGDRLHVRVEGEPAGAKVLLVRDAQRGADGLLATAKPLMAQPEHPLPPAVLAHPRREDAEAARPTVDVGPFVATLVNGIFGDPLLLLRQRHGSRALIFDLGEAVRLRARLAHHVTDVFVSHAHIDHIVGFLWLLRSRIGAPGTCRIFGPAGLAKNIAGMIAGIHWDRIGEGGPRFDVTELHDGDRAIRFTIAAGDEGARRVAERAVRDGLLLEDALLCVRAAVLDHRTPVLAFALEPRMEVKVRKERLAALGMAPGPWLTTLKRHIVAGEHEALVRLPDGDLRSVRSLADELVIVRPGEKLAYATDLADTPDNRARLAKLAAGAQTFFCEATFGEAHAEHAARKGHLTARACGEIAAAAGVERLVPFHFSRRYAEDPAPIYREVRAACARVVGP